VKYVYTGLAPDSLDDGRPVGFGDEVELTEAQAAANARLTDADLLRPKPRPARKRPAPAR
jgi:hypothetical protein